MKASSPSQTPSTETPTPGFPPIPTVRWFHWVVAVVILGLFLWRAGAALVPDPRISDSQQYLVMASNLARLGTLSLDLSDQQGRVAPTCLRLPGYPSFLAGCLLLTPRLLELKPAELIKDPLNTLKLWQLGVLLVTALVGGVAGALMVGSMWAGLACFALICLHPLNLQWAGWLLSENLTAFLITMTSLLLVALVRWPRPWLALACGLVLGALGLTRGVFFYLWLLGGGFLVWTAWGRGWRMGRSLLLALLLGVGFWVMASPWLVRNHQQFGQWVTTQRGGIVLALRADYNQMTGRELVGSFYTWTSWYRPQMLIRWLFYPKYFDDGDVRNLDYNNPEGYRRRFFRRMDALKDKHHGNLFLAEAEIAAQAKKELLSRPWRLLITTPSFFNRGIWVGEGRWYFLPFALFWALALASLFLKRHDIQALVLTAFYSYSMHSLATHNIPRYTVPLWPIFLVSTVVVVFLLAGWIWGRFKVSRRGLGKRRVRQG